MRRVFTTLAVIAALLTGGLVFTTATASASSVRCNSVKEVTLNSQGHFIRLPYYKATGSRNCTLSEGASGTAVAALQLALQGCNFASNLAADSEFGPMTKKAVAYAQYRHGISSDGVYGPDSRKAFGWPVYSSGVPIRKCARAS